MVEGKFVHYKSTPSISSFIFHEVQQDRPVPFAKPYNPLGVIQERKAGNLDVFVQYIDFLLSKHFVKESQNMMDNKTLNRYDRYRFLSDVKMPRAFDTLKWFE